MTPRSRSGRGRRGGAGREERKGGRGRKKGEFSLPSALSPPPPPLSLRARVLRSVRRPCCALTDHAHDAALGDADAGGRGLRKTQRLHRSLFLLSLRASVLVFFGTKRACHWGKCGCLTVFWGGRSTFVWERWRGGGVVRSRRFGGGGGEREGGGRETVSLLFPPLPPPNASRALLGVQRRRAQGRGRARAHAVHATTRGPEGPLEALDRDLRRPPPTAAGERRGVRGPTRPPSRLALLWLLTVLLTEAAAASTHTTTTRSHTLSLRSHGNIQRNSSDGRDHHHNAPPSPPPHKSPSIAPPTGALSPPSIAQQPRRSPLALAGRTHDPRVGGTPSSSIPLERAASQGEGGSGRLLPFSLLSLLLLPPVAKKRTNPVLDVRRSLCPALEQRAIAYYYTTMSAAEEEEEGAACPSDGGDAVATTELVAARRGGGGGEAR